jgi:hypothetical protein
LAVSDSQEPTKDIDTAAEETDSKLSGVTAKVGDVTQRLKPAASAAESVVVKTVNAAETVAFHTVHQSARGLSRVDAYLSDRRERRRDGPQPTAVPETSATTDAQAAATSPPVLDQGSESVQA